MSHYSRCSAVQDVSLFLRITKITSSIQPHNPDDRAMADGNESVLEADIDAEVLINYEKRKRGISVNQRNAEFS